MNEASVASEEREENMNLTPPEGEKQQDGRCNDYESSLYKEDMLIRIDETAGKPFWIAILDL